MKTLVIFFLIILVAILAIGCSKDNGESRKTLETAAEIDHDEPAVAGDTNRPEKLELPPHFLNLLNQEMQQIESGMQLLLDYLARGEAQNAADIAMQIHDSFILKQSLSQEELQQLVSLLPTGFIHMDRAFHGQAKELAEAAQQNDFTTSIKIYGEMAQACVSCHAQYSPEKFSGLAKQREK